MKDTIMEMPDYQRPYEKCLREGEQSLSDRELLAVILRCGVQGLSSLTLADKILNLSEQTGHSGLLGLFHASVPELMKIPPFFKWNGTCFWIMMIMSARIFATTIS